MSVRDRKEVRIGDLAMAHHALGGNRLAHDALDVVKEKCVPGSRADGRMTARAPGPRRGCRRRSGVWCASTHHSIMMCCPRPSGAGSTFPKRCDIRLAQGLGRTRSVGLPARVDISDSLKHPARPGARRNSLGRKRRPPPLRACHRFRRTTSGRGRGLAQACVELAAGPDRVASSRVGV